MINNIYIKEKLNILMKIIQMIINKKLVHINTKMK